MADLPNPDEGRNLPRPYRPPGSSTRPQQPTMFDPAIHEESRRQSGGPPPPTGPDYNSLFLAELKAINANTKEMLTLLPQELTDASNQVCNELQNLQAKLTAPAATGGQPSPTASSAAALDEATLNRILGAARGGAPKEPLGDIWGRKQDAGWRGRAKDGVNAMSWTQFPGSTASPLDFIRLFGTMTADAAAKRQPGFDAQKEKEYQAGLAKLVENADATLFSDLLSKYGSSAQIPLDVLRKQENNDALDQDALKQLQKDTTPDESRWGKVSNFFGSAAKSYAEGKTMMDMVQNLTKTSGGLADYAYATGYEGGASGSPLPFGLGQSTGGAEQALRQRAQQAKFSLNNHISVPQGRTIYDNLYGNGWYGGGATDAMRAGAADMMHSNPYIASMPMYYALMDQSTRYGASSIEHFNDVMKSVPESAKAAKIGMTDMVNALQSLGDYNQSTGGTFIQGMDNAKDWAQNTGTSPLVMQQLMQNPLVQGQTFMQTGLMPFEQGLASSGQHTQGILSSLNLLDRAIVTPANRVSIDPITGEKHIISGQSQKEALMAKQLGVNPEYLHTMLRNKKGWLQGSEMQDAADTYRQTVINDVRHGRSPIADLQGAPLSKLQSAMMHATDAQGHHMFEDWATFRKDKKANMTDKAAHRDAQAQARANVMNAGDDALVNHASKAQLAEYEHRLGIDTTRYHKYTSPPGRAAAAVLPHGGKYNIALTAAQKHAIAQAMTKDGFGLHGRGAQIVASKRAAMIKHEIAQNTQKFGPNQGNQGPHIQIELGPAAKKMFRLSDPKGQQKANKNSGSQSQSIDVNVVGPTASPYPDLNTVGGSSSFQYGSPADDGSY